MNQAVPRAVGSRSRPKRHTCGGANPKSAINLRGEPSRPRAARRGILMCGTGLGMSYTANRFPGVRAALAWEPEIAELARRHNDANVLILPARFIEADFGVEILRRWLDAPFEGGRHTRRVEKIERET